MIYSTIVLPFRLFFVQLIKMITFLGSYFSVLQGPEQTKRQWRYDVGEKVGDGCRLSFVVVLSTVYGLLCQCLSAVLVIVLCDKEETGRAELPVESSRETETHWMNRTKTYDTLQTWSYFLTSFKASLTSSSVMRSPSTPLPSFRARDSAKEPAHLTKPAMSAPENPAVATARS